MDVLNCPFPGKGCKLKPCLKNCFPCVKPVVDYMVLYLESVKGGNNDGKSKKDAS